MKISKKLILPLLGLTLAIPRLGLAATFTVDQTDDVDHGYVANSGACPSPCSIRDAVNVSNDGDTVDIPAALGQITFTAGGSIPINTSITIQGAGPGTSIIDAADLSNIFDVDALGTGEAVTITGVALQNGKTTGDGGAILNNLTAALTLSNCTVTSNEADDNGGGIANFGSLTIVNCTISNNVADFDMSDDNGGGIYSEGGSLFIDNSTISGNSTGATGGGDGGGIDVDNGTAEIRDTTLSNNTADGQGGGLAAPGSDSTTTIAGTGDGSLCNITGNHATTEDGGGINNDQLMVVDNCLIDNNTADATDGGGIANDGNLTLTRSVVNDNHALLGSGGGISTGEEMVIENSTISNNDVPAANNGGGIFNTEELLIFKTTITGNSAGGDGGGIHSDDSGDTILGITNSTIFDNQANGNGGGLFNNDQTSLNNVTIANNTADADAVGGGMGGGIFNSNSVLTFNNTIIANNTDDGTGPDCLNDFTIGTNSMVSAGPNMITNTTGCETTGVPVIVDNPDLAATLANNGGPTQAGGAPTLTLALLSTSPAIDAGDNNTCEATDERGTSRPQGTNCDLGAFEAGPSADLSTLTVTFGEQVVGTTSAAQTVTLTNNGTIALTINSIVSLLGSDFAQTNDCGASLAVGSSCTITITFGPTGALGVITGSITVDTSANVQLITLLGAAIAAAAGGGGCGCDIGNTVPVNPVMILGFAGLALAGLVLRRKIAK